MARGHARDHGGGGGGGGGGKKKKKFGPPPPMVMAVMLVVAVIVAAFGGCSYSAIRCRNSTKPNAEEQGSGTAPLDRTQDPSFLRLDSVSCCSNAKQALFSSTDLLCFSKSECSLVDALGREPNPLFNQLGSKFSASIKVMNRNRVGACHRSSLPRKVMATGKGSARPVFQQPDNRRGQALKGSVQRPKAARH